MRRLNCGPFTRPGGEIVTYSNFTQATLVSLYDIEAYAGLVAEQYALAQQMRADPQATSRD